MTYDSIYDLESNIIEKKQWFELLNENKQKFFFIKRLIGKRNKIF